MDRTDVLVRMMKKEGVNLKICSFEACEWALRGMSDGEIRIGIKRDMPFDKTIHSMAQALAHLYLFYDKGDTINHPNHKKYDEQTDRAADLILAVIEEMEVIQSEKEKCKKKHGVLNLLKNERGLNYDNDGRKKSQKRRTDTEGSYPRKGAAWCLDRHQMHRCNSGDGGCGNVAGGGDVGKCGLVSESRLGGDNGDDRSCAVQKGI